MSDHDKTKLSNKVLLPEWVTIRLREGSTPDAAEQPTSNTVDQVMPRPDLQRKPAAQNTKWRR